MIRTPVISSNIESAGFDYETQNMEVEFNSGAVYRYFEVPFDIYVQMMQAESVGSFFNKEIKPNYTFEKLFTIEKAKIGKVVEL